MRRPKTVPELRQSADSVEPKSNPFKKIPEYQLQVVTEIARSNLAMIYKLGPELVGLIQDTGVLTLTHSSWYITEDVVRLHAYWDMHGDADSLTIAELQIPDKPAYAKFDQIMLSEVKDIVLPVPGGSMKSDVDPQQRNRYVYLRAMYQVETAKLSEFSARLQASVIPFAYKYGWMLGDAYLGVTGRAGSIVQLWIVPERVVQLAPQRLAATPWHELLKERPQYLVLEPTPTDPILGTEPVPAPRAEQENPPAAASAAE